jgi:hypothetical protein
MTKVEYLSHEGIVEGDARRNDLEKTMVVFSLGGPPFNRKALAIAVLSWRGLNITPTTAVVFHVAGYDDDPRELWQIEEVCDFLRRFCHKTDAHKSDALDPASRSLLLACGADPTVNVRVIPISAEQSLNESSDFFKSRLKETP